MSLHTKLDNHQKQLKAFLEEHAAMVEARLAGIEARLSGPDDGPVLEEAGVLREDNQKLVDGLDEAAQENLKLVEENYSLRATLEAVAQESSNEIGHLKSEIFELAAKVKAMRAFKDAFEASRDEVGRLTQDLEEAKKATRYPGCYNLSGRRAHVRTVAEVYVILGGQTNIEKTLGIRVSTLQPWRAINSIPFEYKDTFTKALNERGYFADDLLFKRTKEKR